MTSTTQASLNDTLREWREAAGLDLDETAVEAKRILGRAKLSRETIRRYETEYPIEKMDGLVLIALLRLYGRSEAELPPDAFAAIERLRDLVAQLRCIWVPAGQGTLFPALVAA